MRAKLKNNSIARSKYLFVYGLLAYPLLNFIIFYVIVNFNSILLAFQNTDTETFKSVWVGLDNFKQIAVELVQTKNLLSYIEHSILFWVLGTLIGMPLNILFGYLFLVKIKGTPFIRFCIMIPSIISGLVTAMLFSKFAENAMPVLFDQWFDIQTISLLRDERYNLGTILVYTLLTGFSYNIIIYMNAMKGNSESLFEVARLEGATHLQTLWYVCFPSVYTIMTTFIVTSVPGILAGDPGLYLFYEYNAPESVMTSGYYIFIKTKNNNGALIDYSYAAAMGLMFTLFSFPLTLFVRWFMDKVDPNREM